MTADRGYLIFEIAALPHRMELVVPTMLVEKIKEEV